ncbi:MAG: LysR family transcriptional regulator [bacterium]
MELMQLKYYVTIAENLSFTKAADLLHISQPALSYQMRRLESELGARLFDRGRRKIALTADGEIFLPLAQAVLFRANEATRVFREHLGVEAGEVRMGCNPSVATYLVPSLLASFRGSFPRVRVYLVEGGDVELQRDVLEGTIDFAVVTAPGSPKTLDVTPLAAEDLLLVVPPGHRHAARSSVALGELAYEQFVFPTDSFNMTAQLIDACRRVGFEPRVAYQTGSLESVKGFVRQGLGVSVVPRMAVEGPGKEGLVILQVEGGLTRDLNLIAGKNRSTTGAARALMIHVRTSLSGKAGHMLPSRPPASGGLEAAVGSVLG